MPKKDIILILGGGGMAGVFSAGVLKAFEDETIFNRVHSVYAVSVGGCNGARFLTKDSELGGWGFYNVFNNGRFINKRFVRYYFQILRRHLFGHGAVDDIFDFNYFSEMMLRSEIKIDMAHVVSSAIPFFVKVFNADKRTHHYLPVTEPDAFTKVLASASATPLISRRFLIEGDEFFDGDTIASTLEADIAAQHSDKLIIKINNTKEPFFGVLNFFTLFVVYTLLFVMHDSRIAGMYAKGFFRKPFLEHRLRRFPNVLVVQNGMRTGLFTEDTALLKKTYAHGFAKGEAMRRILAEKKSATMPA